MDARHLHRATRRCPGGGRAIIGQKIVDDDRSDRSDREGAAAAAVRRSHQLEDLRLVCDGSSPEPDRQRVFAHFDLEDQNLVGLHLAGADFAHGNLAGAALVQTDLSRANFTGSKLANADIRRANLRGAYFGVSRLIDSANQLGANLSGANLFETRPDRGQPQSRQPPGRQIWPRPT